MVGFDWYDIHTSVVAVITSTYSADYLFKSTFCQLRRRPDTFLRGTGKKVKKKFVAVFQEIG